jgi:excinuclease ABC subunit C
MPGWRPSRAGAAKPFKLKPRDPCSISCSGCATKRIASPSARTASAPARYPRGRAAGNPRHRPTRKRALLHHFGTLKAIERAALSDLAKVPGISAETARKIYDFFHERAG